MSNLCPETAQRHELDRAYEVQAVFVRDWISRFTGWLPVIGPQHEDAEIVGFPYQHWHIDWRFASKRAYEAVLGRDTRGRPEFLYAWPVMVCGTDGIRIVIEGPVVKRMTYKRELPPYPRPPLTAKSWPEALAAKFACARLVDGKCPHRGISVAAMRRDGDILECPGHGLRWHAVTGKAVT